MEPVNAAPRMQRNDGPIGCAILVPRPTVAGPGSPWHEGLDVLGEVANSIFLWLNGFDALCLAFFQHADNIFGHMFGNSEDTAMANWGARSQEYCKVIRLIKALLGRSIEEH